MNYSIYLRPLKLADASISYKWRNNPEIWKFTRFSPAKPITKPIEEEWLKNVLRNKNEARFAICLQENGRYLGNVQITDIQNNNGEFHLFIGDASFWGKGIGQEATSLMLDYGFKVLRLDFIRLDVHQENLTALAIYKKIGFKIIDKNGDFFHMALRIKDYSKLQLINKVVSRQYISRYIN